MRSRIAWLRAALVLVAVVVADQLTKRWIADSIMPGQTRHVLPGLQFVHTFNDGVAFGLAPGGHTIVIALIGLALLGVLLYFARHSTRRLVWLPTGLLIGGALSNILDRVRDGSVTDFIKLPLGWPPFNLADAAITIGVLILALVVESGVRGDAARSVPDPEDASRRGWRRPRLRSSE
jgi:signal peptidase II